MILLREIIKKRQQCGFTFAELLIASVIAILVLSFLAYLTIFTAKSIDLLYTQMTQQVQAVRAVQTISDILRNALFSTVTSSPSMGGRN